MPQKKKTMIIAIDKKYDSHYDLYYALITLYNVIERWCLTETQVQILVYLMRHGYSKETKKIICERVGISEKSLTTNLSYLRQGKVGKKKIKKLLIKSRNNQNNTEFSVELNSIKKMIEDEASIKTFIVDFGEETLMDSMKKKFSKK